MRKPIIILLVCVLCIYCIWLDRKNRETSNYRFYTKEEVAKMKADEKRRGEITVSAVLLNNGTNIALVIWDYGTRGTHIHRLKMPAQPGNYQFTFYENGEYQEWPEQTVTVISNHIHYGGTNWIETTNMYGDWEGFNRGILSAKELEEVNK